VESNLVQNPKLLSNLPSSWSVLFFQDLVKDFSGGNKKILKSEFLDKGKYLIVDQGKEMVAGFTNDVDALVNSSPPYIIFGDHTRIFKYINVAFAMGADGTKVLKAQDENNLNEKFLYYFFLTLNIPNTGYNRHFKYLKNSKIPLPPLAEQQKIAEILDAADALRQKDQQLIDHYTTLSQSLFLEMFGDPVTNPMGWDAIHLNNVIHVKHGFAFRSKFFSNEGAYVLLTPGNFDAEGGYRDQGMKQKYYTGDFPNEYLLKQNDLLLAMTEQAVGLLGCPLFVPNNEMFLHNQRLGLVEIIGAVNRVYLFSLFNSSVIRQLIHIKATGTKVRHTSPTKIKEIKVGIPPLELQNQFANHIANIEKQKQQAQASLVQSNNLFNSLLQKAFTGELTA